MLKVSKLADYSTVIMTHISNVGGKHSAKDISDSTNISHPTVTKLLKILSKSGMLSSTKGLRGGYELSKSPEDISLLDIINAVEGDIALTECSKSSENCSIASSCCIASKWQSINRVVRDSLSSMNLAKMSQGPIMSRSNHG